MQWADPITHTKLVTLATNTVEYWATSAGLLGLLLGETLWVGRRHDLVI